MKYDKKVCVLLLQRNMPEVTNKTGSRIVKNSGDIADFYVIESGSDDDKLSQFTETTLHANWPDVKINGLRTGRGFNYGLSELDRLGKKYKYYLMMTGDAIVQQDNFVNVMSGLMEENPQCGILAPVHLNGGFEFDFLFKEKRLTAYWLLSHVCWMMRGELIEKLSQGRKKDFMDYIYDGTNFRCYDADTEIIVKTYMLNYYFGICSSVSIDEDHSIAMTKSSERKTEDHNTHRSLMFKEGMEWLKKKYGFSTKQQMRALVRNEFNNFFARNPHLAYLVPPGKKLG